MSTRKATSGAKPATSRIIDRRAAVIETAGAPVEAAFGEVVNLIRAARQRRW